MLHKRKCVCQLCDQPAGNCRRIKLTLATHAVSFRGAGSKRRGSQLWACPACREEMAGQFELLDEDEADARDD